MSCVWHLERNNHSFDVRLFSCENHFSSIVPKADSYNLSQVLCYSTCQCITPRFLTCWRWKTYGTFKCFHIFVLTCLAVSGAVCHIFLQCDPHYVVINTQSVSLSLTLPSGFLLLFNSNKGRYWIRTGISINITWSIDV